MLKARKVGIVSLSVFLCSQSFKVPLNNFLGFDFVVILFPLLVITSITQFKNINKKRLQYIGMLLLIPLVVMVSLLFSFNFQDEYKITKIINFFTLSLGALLVPLTLFKTIIDIKYFIYSLLYMSLFSSVLSFLIINYGAHEMIDRYQYLSANPIIVSRVASIGLIISSILFFNKKISLLFFSVIIIFVLYIMLFSGSRGPLYASIALIVFYVLVLKGAVKYIYIIMLVVLLVFFYQDAIINYLPTSAFERLFLGGGSDSSGARVIIWVESYNILFDSLFGVGFGGFSEYISISDSYKLHRYPHNIFLELGVEVGFLSMVLFFIIVAISTRNYFKSRSKSIYITILFYLYILFFLQAQVSGDINGNRIFLTLLAVGLISLSIKGTTEVNKSQ